MKVLLIDDDKVSNLVLKMAVTNFKDVTYKYANSFRQALKMMKDIAFDVVFIDFSFPGGNSSNFIDRYLSGTRTYLISAYSESEILKRIDKIVPVTGFINKSSLLSEMKSVLNEKLLEV